MEKITGTIFEDIKKTEVDNKYKWFDDDKLKERAYAFTFVLYKDSTDYSYETIINRVQFYGLNDEDFRYAFIEHNKEEDVKPHTHLYIKYKYQHHLKRVLDTFSLENYNPHSDIDDMGVVVRNSKSLLKYFCHLDKRSRSLSKYEYPTDDIISNIPQIINSLKNQDEVIDVFLNIVDFINNMDRIVTLKDVITYCRNNEPLYLVVLTDRKYSYMISQTIKERNIEISL